MEREVGGQGTGQGGFQRRRQTLGVYTGGGRRQRRLEDMRTWHCFGSWSYRARREFWVFSPRLLLCYETCAERCFGGFRAKTVVKVLQFKALGRV